MDCGVGPDAGASLAVHVNVRVWRPVAPHAVAEQLDQAFATQE